MMRARFRACVVLLVTGGQLADEDADGPAVGDDVMHVDEQHMIIFSQAEKFRAEQRASLNAERCLPVLPDQFPHPTFSGTFGNVADVLDRNREPLAGENDLHGLAVAAGRESRAQDFMSPYDLRQAVFQQLKIDCALEAEDRRAVVGVAAGLQLIEKPRALLCG